MGALEGDFLKESPTKNAQIVVLQKLSKEPINIHLIRIKQNQQKTK